MRRYRKFCLLEAVKFQVFQSEDLLRLHSVGHASNSNLNFAGSPIKWRTTTKLTQQENLSEFHHFKKNKNSYQDYPRSKYFSDVAIIISPGVQ